MLFRLFLLFTLVPVAELAILIRIGGWLGLAPTLALVIGTGAVGAWLARREGIRSWLAVQEELATGRIPARELVHGLLILVAGVVLLTPGVLTDIAGLLLLVRPFRTALMRRLRARFERQIDEGTITVIGGPGFASFGAGLGRSAGFPGEDGARGRRGARDAPGGREILVDEPEIHER
ncbi:MAG: FxsA family protein [Gemmatimonadota bacterium]|nr:FxsA family protein [Gemmatimonadota bacterium]